MQSRLQLFGKARFTIQEELQADCFAGSWTKWISSKGYLEAGDLREAQLTLFRARDPLDMPWFAPGAHGTAQQRTRAFDQGFSGNTIKVCITR
jgi:predicted metalloprotease